MDLLTEVLLQISATAHIAHKVTKNKAIQCTHCIKFDLPCFFKLSSQGCHNNLAASNFAKVADDAAVVARDGIEVDADVDEVTASKENKSIHSFDLSMNKSVHYHHHTYGYSCHGRVKQVTLQEGGAIEVCPSHVPIQPWVHVFAKSTRSCSLRTKAAAIAYIELPVHKKLDIIKIGIQRRN